MGTTSETDLVWVEELKAALAQSFPGEYQPQTLQRFQQCVEEEMLLSSDRKRLNLLFETLLNFYSHFCWKIKFNKPSEIMKNGFIHLLANLIKVGLTVKCEARLRTILTVLTDDDDMLYSALLLVTHLKKKCQESYGVLLGDILCSRPLNPSTPESYLKVILLLRRLKSLSHKIPRQLASPPIHTISWLQQHCPNALPEKPKPHILTNHLMQKKLPSEVLKDLREMLLPFDDQPCLSKEDIKTEESIEDAYVIDSGDPSSHQDLNHKETDVSRKKRKSTVREEKTNKDGFNKITLCDEVEEIESKKKSKKTKHLHETEESIEEEESSLQNEIEIFELPDYNTEMTKSKKKICKSKKVKDSTLQLSDQVKENSPFEEIMPEETKIDMDTSKLNKSGDINEESIDKKSSCQKEIIINLRKRKILLDTASSSPHNSVITEKDCNSLSCSKITKQSKRKKPSTSKEELNNLSCNLATLSNSVAGNESMNKSVDASNELHTSFDSSLELDHEDAIEERELPRRLKIKKKKNALKFQSPNSEEGSKIINEAPLSDSVELTHENLQKDKIEKVLTEDKQVPKTPKKSKKSLCKNKDSKSQSDLLQKAEEKTDEMVNIESEKQLLESSEKVIPYDSQAKNQLQDKDSENYLPNLLGVNDFKDQNSNSKMFESDANTYNVCKSNSSSTAAKYEEQSEVLLKSSIINCQKKNLHGSPIKRELNSEKEEITGNHESSSQNIDKSSTVDVEIKENIQKLTEENGNIHCNEIDSSVMTQSSYQLPSGSEEANGPICVMEDSTKEAVQDELDNNEIYSPKILLQKITEKCVEESFKIEDEKEERENEIKGIKVSSKSSFESLKTASPYSENLKKENSVQCEEQNFDQPIAVERVSQVKSSIRIQVFPQLIKKNENFEEEKSELIGIKNTPIHDSKSLTVKSSPKKELVETHNETHMKNEVDHENQAISMYKSEFKRGIINVHCSENSINKISVKSQSSDSEMSLKEANINEYEEKLYENIESEKVKIPEKCKSKLHSNVNDVKSDSDESFKESLDLDRNVEELSESLIKNKQMTKTRKYRKNNKNFPSTTDLLCYDSEESISSLNLEEEENSLNIKALKEELTLTHLPQSLILSEKEDNESKSLNPEIVSNKSHEQDILFTPRKSKRLKDGKQSNDNLHSLDEGKTLQKLPRNLPDSNEIQNTSCANHLIVNDESNINSAVDSNTKSNIKTRSKKGLDSEMVPKRTRDCCVVLDNILESTGELIETLKEELSTTDEEPVQKFSQETELNFTKKDSNLSLNHSPLKENNWTLSYESDSSPDKDKSDVEKSKKRYVSHSKKISKTVKPLSNLDSLKELHKLSEPEQEVGCRRYNLRKTNKIFPYVKQPDSQKLATIPGMSFSPLIKKAKNYPKFSDVSLPGVPLCSIKEPIFNENYRESPADLTINEAALKLEDETSSIEGESLSLPMEPENMSQPVESKENVGQVSVENNSDLESSQEISENTNDKPPQHMEFESTSNHSPVKNSESKSLCPESTIKISKSRLKPRTSSKRLRARGYSLRSRGATVELDLNLKNLTLGTPLKKVNPKEKDTEEDKESSMLKDSKVPENPTYLRRSKRNIVLPGKLKL